MVLLCTGGFLSNQKAQWSFREALEKMILRVRMSWLGISKKNMLQGEMGNQHVVTRSQDLIRNGLMSLEKHRTASNQIPWEWDQEKRVGTKSQKKSSNERKVLALSKSPFFKQHSQFFSIIQIAVLFHVNTISAQLCHPSPIAGPDKAQEYVPQAVY